MSNNLPTTATFNQVLKSPHVYMLMFAVSLIWFFVGKFGDSADQVNDNCEAEKKALRIDNANKDLRIENLTDAILYYRGINIQIREEADSLVRAKVGKQSTEIVNKNQK